MSGKIQIEGKDYKVIEKMGYSHSAGAYVAEVETPEGPRIAVKYRGGAWWFWTSGGKTQ